MLKVVHTPVMRVEIIDYLTPRTGDGLIIDGTVGEGGHSLGFLEWCEGCRLIGLDADSSMLPRAAERLAAFGDRVELHHAWFNQFFADYPRDLPAPSAILLDLGISLYHYEQSGRGFSFRKPEALDMRLDSGLETSAADIVNEYPEEEIAELLSAFGEERYARRIARAICRTRVDHTIEESSELASIVEGAVPPEYRHGRIHAATRTFQALRIAVNGELARLEQALESAVEILVPGGRIGVISFHSLEDRIVKRFFRDKATACTCPPDWPVCRCGGVSEVEVITKRPVPPTEAEAEANPPSRSAKFRVAEKREVAE